MIDYVERFLLGMRPAFSRRATFVWFVVVFVGFLVRSDTLGVSSIVRALYLTPDSYPCLLHFFHSTAWNVESLMTYWWGWQAQEPFAYRVGNRIVLLADHTKTPKDGRKIPAVTTLHQDSETASKPTFFRGHHWGCVSQLMTDLKKSWAAPLWARIHQGLEQVDGDETPTGTMATQTVNMAQTIAQKMGINAYLVLDAFFAVGSVFKEAAKEINGERNRIHVLTRAKKNVAAYLPYPKPRILPCGRPRKYGNKLKLMNLFVAYSWQPKFQSVETTVYQKKETIRYLTLDLLWKPTKGLLRFILIETSRGRIILMTSDLTLDPLVALHLYCERIKIEVMFDTLKNVLGGLAYHFWSKPLPPVSRRPTRNASPRPKSSRPELTRNTFRAIEKFVNVQLLVLGFLQLVAAKFPLQVWSKSKCWLRTYTSETPSEFVTRSVLCSIIRCNLFGFGKDWITHLIHEKQNNSENPAILDKTG
ncbi:MAG: transposase [Planctomycetes bacterium]|nr:transposase [Planctomycetota bacterium]